MKTLWVMVRSLLAFSGFLAIAGFALFNWSVNHPDPDDSVEATLYPSPDGVYTAAYLFRSGGLAISPVCSDTIVVFSSISRIEDVSGRPVYEVYSGDCSFFSESLPRPKITWASYNELQIDIDLGKGRHNVSMKAMDATQKVAIKFSAGRKL